ncbi:hypothetical protein [Halorubellus litoreus]|uniref:Uncharacterized protein n=1 Tax=Halorubellus litoreus TaxID=755308 RepID=A0ABD5VG79_9EURY
MAILQYDHVQKLNDHQRVLYDIIAEQSQVSPGELYEEYWKRVEEPKTRRMMRNHHQKMARYNLVRPEGEGRGREHHHVF